MPNETGIPDGETWHVLDYFGPFLMNSRKVVRVTKTRLVTEYGAKFCKPGNLEDGTHLRKVGGNDHHLYVFRKIINGKGGPGENVRNM